MKITVIGGTGHIGTYLIPRLITTGHEVICVSRQKSEPYHMHPSWKSVTHISIDRTKAEEQGSFGAQINELQPEVLIDLICFNQKSAELLVEALQGNIKHFIHCGTMWVHGHSEQVPTRENQERKPFGDYGIKKAEIESYLLSAYKKMRFPATILHPGHITGPGWLPINPAGNLDPKVFQKLAKGKEVVLPNLGMETLHHVHADDVARAFINTIENRQNSIGESFHIVSEQALTLRGYAMAIAEWYEQEANLSFSSWKEWKKTVSQRDSELTWDHIAHSPNGSIEKAMRLLNYKPKYTSLQAIQEAITHYFTNK